MFAEYCENKFSVEPVEVVRVDGSVRITPDMSTHQITASVDEITKNIGITLEPERVAQLVSSMSLTGKLSDDKKTLVVDVPATRSDIIHACDIVEDVAIAYGFNNIPIVVPTTATIGHQQPVNKLTDLLRAEIAFAGYSEVFNFALCSREETFKLLNRPDDGSAVGIANPKTSEFEVARTSLLVGILKTVSHNRKNPLPIRVFELSDVVLKNNSYDVGACNRRNLSALYCSHSAGFEIIHGLLDRVMTSLGVQWREEGKQVEGNYYYIKPSEDPAFFPGRRADIFFNDSKIGVMGIVHPDVLNNFHIPFPCSALEICVEPFITIKTTKY